HDALPIYPRRMVRERGRPRGDRTGAAHRARGRVVGGGIEAAGKRKAIFLTQSRRASGPPLSRLLGSVARLPSLKSSSRRERRGAVAGSRALGHAGDPAGPEQSVVV